MRDSDLFFASYLGVPLTASWPYSRKGRTFETTPIRYEVG